MTLCFATTAGLMLSSLLLLQQGKLEKLIYRRKFMWLLIVELFERKEVHGCYSTVLPLVLEHLLCYRHTVTESSERKVCGSCLVMHST